ncbi:SatD family (SatD) [Chitinophaga costaii]|uniref:SatD family (SatD) n=1 Tax=Chitinophaga costaii TaxID=1335309 RepID=A0A1C4FBB0_9BACT|nr:SatD family protein [Chitinophaga costaii]PUZ20718.1 hypothetical protein DCM91_18325 [Chitinophaga costaii]SCC53154.1 SatD family (SatD) [Chitinophaga costaii]
MSKHLYFILMADIIGSRQSDQRLLMADFKALVTKINKKQKKTLLSPITITLGDEFQGIIHDLPASLKIMLEMEEMIIALGKTFKLRYVLMQGEIDTPINPSIAYEMLGPGLTAARETLNQLKRDHHRFEINLQDQALSGALNNSFFALQSIVDNWNPEKDYALVDGFLRYIDYKKVAAALHKTPSLMWKREKSLQIKAYNALKAVINYLGGN